MKAITPHILLLFASIISLHGASVIIGFPDSYSDIEKKEGNFDAASGDVIIATAVHDSGAKAQISFNSRIPVSNDDMPRFS